MPEGRLAARRAHGAPRSAGAEASDARGPAASCRNTRLPLRLSGKLRLLGRRQEGSSESSKHVGELSCVFNHGPEASDQSGRTGSVPVYPPSSSMTTAPFLEQASASFLLDSERGGQRLFLSLVFPDNHEFKIIKIPKGIFKGKDSAPPHYKYLRVCL